MDTTQLIILIGGFFVVVLMPGVALWRRRRP
jgi:hypothetical protein